VRGALFVLPVIALANYSLIAVAPILAVVRVGKILENSTDYSIQNTLRQALFLPTTREAKYKAKAAIDTFFTRTGDVVSPGSSASSACRFDGSGICGHQRRADDRMVVGGPSDCTRASPPYGVAALIVRADHP
jgi:hypothetical protein